MKLSSFSRVLALASCGLLFSLAVAQAQIPPGGGPQPGAGGGPSATVPIDGGASLLLIGGVSYAMRRLRKRRTA